VTAGTSTPDNFSPADGSTATFLLFLAIPRTGCPMPAIFRVFSAGRWLPRNASLRVFDAMLDEQRNILRKLELSQATNSTCRVDKAKKRYAKTYSWCILVVILPQWCCSIELCRHGRANGVMGASRIILAFCLTMLLGSQTPLPKQEYAQLYCTQLSLNQAKMAAQGDADIMKTALMLMRRTDPEALEDNAEALSALLDEDIADEFMQRVDLPLQVVQDSAAGKAFLASEFNADGDAYRCDTATTPTASTICASAHSTCCRSPWSNKFYPTEDASADAEPLQGKLRKLEEYANEVFDVYRHQ